LCSTSDASSYATTPPKAEIRDPGPVTAKRVVVGRGREQGLYLLPDGIEHLGLERAHDVRGPPLVVGFG
jgi:hypothetical protein